MTKSNKQTSERTTLIEPLTNGLGEINIAHPPDTFSVTPASLITIQAITEYQDFLTGNGLDWGSGTGCLAITAARIPSVKQVIGLELSEPNVTIAKQNAITNGVDDKATFLVSDSYSPSAEIDRDKLNALAGQVNFILANPPSSEGDDGFSWRRRVLNGARDFLARGGKVFLSVSSQYGQQRVEQLSEEISGFTYHGILTTTDWTPFDLNRSDLLLCLHIYAAEEKRGGLAYTFHDAESDADNGIDARSVLAKYEKTGDFPLMKWQTHLLMFKGN